MKKYAESSTPPVKYIASTNRGKNKANALIADFELIHIRQSFSAQNSCSHF